MKDRQDDILLDNLKVNLPELEKLLEDVNDHWNYEDLVYRFYHHSYKVYYCQGLVKKIVNQLQLLMPEVELNDWFVQIIKEGTEHPFKRSHNKEWLKHTRPVLEALFHAKYFLEMAVKYGKELEKAPDSLPSGWAGFLYLYNMR